MKEAVRVILVDPNARSRQTLQKQLGSVGGVELVEVCTAYQLAIKRISALVPDMAVVVLDENVEQALAMVETVAAGLPGVNLVPAGAEHDASLILRSMRSGAREFLPLPATPIELYETVRRVCPRRDPDAPAGPRGPQVIAVTGAAGGVGCSSMAVNLASTLAKLTRRDTVLADFDLLLGSLEESLAVVPDNSLEVVVRNLDELDPTLLKRWLPRHPSGLYMLPHPVNMEEAARIEPESLRRVLNLLREAFTSVVIDTSKGLQATDFVAFDVADIILVVIQLGLNCTRNTVRLIQYLRQFEGFEEKIRLVVNRSSSPLSEISLRKAQELVKTEVNWIVPNATKLFRPARTQGVPIDEVEAGAGSKAHEAILAMARELQPFPVEQAKGRKTLFKAFSR
jgi:pilus assembly protein CpaE